jgi:Ca-activated chloride channel family protein
MEGFSFANPWLLSLLALVPLLALLKGRRGGAPAIRYSSTAVFEGLGRARASRAGALLAGLLALALISAIIGLARPRLGKTFTRIQASGIDIMLVLDVSRSMLAEDFTIGGQQANRLDAVKQVTEKFIEGRPNDRIGIIAFAGRPYVVSPLTLDHDWLLRNLDRVRIGLVEDGTAIGSALASGGNRLKDKESKSRMLVLLTDGDNNAGKIPPKTAAEAVAAIGIKIYTIGAGTRGFAPFPMRDMFGRTVYQNVKVDMDEDSLREIAQIGGGAYFRASDTRSLEEIFKRIDQMEKTTVEMDKFRQYRDLFPYFVGAAFGLLALQMTLSQTLMRRLP